MMEIKEYMLLLPHDLDFRLITYSKEVNTGFIDYVTGITRTRIINYKHWEATGALYKYLIEHNCKEYSSLYNWFCGDEIFIARYQKLDTEDEDTWERIVPSWYENGHLVVPHVNTLEEAKKQCNEHNNSIINKVNNYLSKE